MMNLLSTIQWEQLFDWQLAKEAAPYILKNGLWNTMWISVVTMTLGLLVALVVAIARMSPYRLLRYPARVYISIIRGTPLLVQLFILYFGLPVIGITLEPITVAIIGLTASVGGYASETIRGAILSIPRGQWEAATSLNMSYRQTMRRVILPQATRVALPSLMNSFLSLVKDTSLLTVITVPEMLYYAKIVGGRSYDYMTVYLIVALYYWVICTVLNALQERLEKHYNRFTNT
ncbi:amino acid ABC transporter membrane protein (PAAT family) [Baia soyae]|uniref:Amino acid ABC transporter membrane protein (PAAT family) n=2 Tax=Baia soyae TaxID=1544746 RepID=A0A4R2S2L0_9BACL|nr:amino acid ABC transporter permease [Baia soyae]TCP70579.1 amino acid ABC transporter membrane protein (PAAT family) [Baia soyae]